MSVEQLKALGLHGLAPLFILAQDGARREVLDEVITTLYAEKQAELLEVTRRLTGLVFKNQSDEDWFARRIAMLDHDYMYEHSWTYRETVDRGIAEGLERGRAEAVAEAEAKQKKILEGERRMVITIAQTRFPQAASLIKDVVENVDDHESLGEIAVKLNTLQTLEMAELYLLGLKQGRELS